LGVHEATHDAERFECDARPRLLGQCGTPDRVQHPRRQHAVRVVGKHYDDLGIVFDAAASNHLDIAVIQGVVAVADSRNRAFVSSVALV
jgi:hypothetical protein